MVLSEVSMGVAFVAILILGSSLSILIFFTTFFYGIYKAEQFRLNN